MKLTFTAFSFFLLSSAFLCAQQVMHIDNRKPFSIGETLAVHSNILDQERIINVYLPLGYDPDSAATYPVIYLLDGTADEDFIHIVGLVQFGSFSWINFIPETIVVGIANIDRKHDLTYPSTDPAYLEKYPTTGGSAKFIDFMDSELQPLIKATYKTNDTTTLIGQSLGGLLASEILFKRPNMFDNYIIISPSLWYDYKSLLNQTPKSFSEGKSIYIGVGSEGRIMKTVAKKLYKKLNAAKNSETKLYFKYFKKNDHGDVLHLAAYDAFNEVFGL